MASKGNSKGYSTGGGKKWLIAIALIVLVAIVVVVVLLCIPPNTYNAVQTLNRTTHSRLLTSNREIESFDDMINKVETGTKYGRYDAELKNTKIVINNVGDILEFYNSNIIYANSNKNLKKNYKSIKNNLNSAKESQSKINSILEDMRKIARDTDELRNTIVDFRREFISWLSYNQKAISALSKGYLGSMGDTLENNVATKVILNTINDILVVIIDDYKDINDIDKKGSLLATNYYTGGNKVSYLNDFIKKYLKSDQSPIYTYYFDNSVKNSFDMVNRFYSEYSENDLTKIISKVSFTDDKYTFDYTFEWGNDTAGNIENAIKNFLGGVK